MRTPPALLTVAVLTVLSLSACSGPNGSTKFTTTPNPTTAEPREPSMAEPVEPSSSPPPGAAVFTIEDAQRAVITDAALDAVGLTFVGMGLNTGQEVATLRQLVEGKSLNVERATFHPGEEDACAMLISSLLVNLSQDSMSSELDETVIVRMNIDADANSARGITLWQGSRVFPTAADAAAHLDAVEAAIPGCPSGWVSGGETYGAFDEPWSYDVPDARAFGVDGSIVLVAVGNIVTAVMFNPTIVGDQRATVVGLAADAIHALG